MGAINVKHTGSGADIALSSDGTSLLLDGTAIGGGGGTALELYAENPSSPTAPSATGTNAVAIGSGAVASGISSIALATVSETTGNFAVAIGAGSDALGTNAIGIKGEARYNQTTAIGTNSGTGRSIAGIAQNSASNAAMALGGSYASGADSLAAAIASNTSSYGATGANSIAIGPFAKATNSQATAIGGEYVTASGFGSLAFGNGSRATGTGSAALGYDAEATANYALALGGGSRARATYTSAIGYGAVADGANSTVIGKSSSTASTHTDSFAIGNAVQTSAANQISIGSTLDTVRISETYTLPTTDGTANQVLTTDGSGAVTFATAGGGGALEFVSKTTLSSTATVEYTGLTAGDTYYLTISDLIQSSTAAYFQSQFLDGNDAALTASNYGTKIIQNGSANLTKNQDDRMWNIFTPSANNSFFAYAYVTISSNGDRGSFNTSYIRTNFTDHGYSTESAQSGCYGAFATSPTGGISGLKLFPSTGTFTSGILNLYKVKDS